MAKPSKPTKARKPRVFLLVGLPHAGVPLLVAALDAHRAPLEAAGVVLPATSADEMFRAAVELRREHRAWGLRRKDVEGTWARATRRVPRRPGVVAVLGHDLLAGAAADQVDLLLDGLAGTAVHVVVAVSTPDPLAGLAPTELDLDQVLTRWRGAVKTPDRVHVLVVDPADPAPAWSALGALVGFDATALPLPDGATADAVPALDTTTLRLLAESTAALLDHDDLVDLAEHWAKVVAEGGYDVHGDVRALVPTRTAQPTDPARALEQARVEVLRSALADAVTEVARLRLQVADLQAERPSGPGRRGPLGQLGHLGQLSGAARRRRPTSGS